MVCHLQSTYWFRQNFLSFFIYLLFFLYFYSFLQTFLCKWLLKIGSVNFFQLCQSHSSLSRDVKATFSRSSGLRGIIQPPFCDFFFWKSTHDHIFITESHFSFILIMIKVNIRPVSFNSYITSVCMSVQAQKFKNSQNHLKSILPTF